MTTYTNKSEYNGETYTVNLKLENDAILGDAATVKLREDNYMLPTEGSPQEAFARASIAYASNEAHANRLYNYASSLWFMYASPVLSNAGNPRGLPASCNLQYVGDSRKEIANTWEELLFLSTMGAGTGIYTGALRSTGQKNSRGTSTPGAVAFIKTFDSITAASRQGEVRRGASAIYMDVSHPEIEEFISIRRATGGDANRKCFNINNAVNIPDAFMIAVEHNHMWDLIDPHTKEVVKTVSARDIWKEILATRKETGEPFLHFIDASNRAMPQPLKDKGLKINQSNLCVSGDTVILTRQGYKDIRSQAGRNVEIWNGERWSKAEVQQTGKHVEMIEVHFDNFEVIKCTPYHKFYVMNEGEIQEVRAKDLEEGMQLEAFDLPESIHHGNLDLADAYSIGFFAGDGDTDGYASKVYRPKFPCLNRLALGVIRASNDPSYLIWRHGNLADFKRFVPNAAYSIKSRLEWLAGLIDSDGHTQGKGIEIKSIDIDFLKSIRLMLQEFGVISSIRLRNKAGTYEFVRPDGGSYDYNRQNCFGLYIRPVGVAKLLDYGLTLSRVVPNRDAADANIVKERIRVVSVEKSTPEDSYCFNEPIRHKGMFNGLLTGNCVEITLPTSPDRTATCFLSSVNLEKYDEWKDDPYFIADLVEMLDNVIDVYCNKAPAELFRAVNAAKSERSIGLGMMGFHSYLQSKMIPFESAIASAVNRNIFENIDTKAKAHSKELAKQRGEAPDMEGSGERFSFITAIAPNSTSSLICGAVSPSIEPFLANTYTQKTARGAFVMRNIHLDNLLRNRYGITGEALEDVWHDISSNGGSVQHLSFLSEHEKDVFKTSFEIDQLWVVDHAASRQPFISQAQSLNVFVDKECDWGVMHAIHKSAWKKGLKTMYYCRSMNVGKIAPTTTIKTVNAECVSCEG